ncbi:uncharacterized protein [Amphiura filiformis]|uniref:uncharacterized protein isoform X2 n=1 Tax=Amphiura filiformis TaxID=82378 RepID=UPI003B21A359
MRLMACFGVVVLLVILDSLSKALATAEESKRNQWLKVDDEDNSFDRENRWHPRRAPQLAKMRPPRNGEFGDNANVDDKFLEEMSRRAWGARFMPGTKNIQGGKRSWDVEDTFDFKRTDDKQALLDAVLEMYDSRTLNNKED